MFRFFDSNTEVTTEKGVSFLEEQACWMKYIKFTECLVWEKHQGNECIEWNSQSFVACVEPA